MKKDSEIVFRICVKLNTIYIEWRKTHKYKCFWYHGTELILLIRSFSLIQILADNIIGRMPMHLGKLKNLKVATFDRNQITALPDESNFLLL